MCHSVVRHTNIYISHSVVTNSLWPKDWSPPGSSVHEILQAKILEWIIISFSRGSSWARDQTSASCISGRFFNDWAIREFHIYIYIYHFPTDSVGKESASNARLLLAKYETQVWLLGQVNPLEKEMAAHSSILTWEIPWTVEPSRLQSMRVTRVRHNLMT